MDIHLSKYILFLSKSKPTLSVSLSSFSSDSSSCIYDSVFFYFCGTHLSLVFGLRTKYLWCRFCLLIAEILKDLSVNTVDKVSNRLIKSYDRRNVHKLCAKLGYRSWGYIGRCICR